ncbi:hypothetical protein WDU94_003803 [Cyamophila willieti]
MFFPLDSQKCRNQPTQQEAVEYQTNIAACNEVYKVIMNSFGQKKSVVFECEPKKDNKDSNGYAGVEVREIGDDSPIKRISPIKRNCNIDDKLDRVVKTVHRNNSQETVDSGVGLEENVVNSFKANASKLMNELGLRGNSVNSREMGNVVDGWKNAKTGVNRESYGSVKDTTKTGKHQDNTSDTSQKSTIVLGSNVSGNDCVNTNNRDKYSSPNDTSSSLTEDFDKVPDLFSVDIEDKLSLIPGKSNKQVVFLKRGELNSLITKLEGSFNGFETTDLDRTKWKLERFETIHESNLRYKRTPFVTDVCTQSYIGQESQGWLLDETMLEHYVEGNKGVGKDSVRLENYETEVQTRTEFEINNEIAKREYGKVQKEHSNIENHGETNTDISKNQGKNSCLETNHNEAEMNENEMEVNSLDLNDLVEIMQPHKTLDSVLKNNYKEFVVKRGVPKIRGATNLVTFKLKTYASKRYGPSVTVDTSQYPTGFDRKQYQVLKDMKVKLENSTKLKNANGLKKEAHLNGNKRSKKGARVPKLTDKKKKLSDKLPVAMLNRKANLKKQLIESKDVSIHDANGDDPKQSIQNSGGMLHFALPRPTLKGQENGSKTPEDTINRKPVKNQVEFLQVQKQSMSKPPNRCQIHESNLRYKRTPFVTDVCTQSYIGQESQGWLLDETMLEHYVEGNKGVKKDSVSLENYETEVQTRTEFEINNEIAKREYGKVQKEHSNIENHGETNTDISKNQGKNSCLETNHNEAEMNENEMEVNSLDLNDLVEIMQPHETLDSVLKNNYKEFVVKRGVPKICGATNLVTFKLKTYASKSSCPSVTVDTSQYPTGFDRKQYQVLKDMKVKLENSTKCKPAKLKNANGLKKEAHLNGNKHSKKGARVPKLTDKKNKLSDKLPVAMLNRKANLKKQLIESKDVSIHDANGDDPKQSIQNKGGMLHFALPRPTLKGQENGSKTPEDTINRKPVKSLVEFLQVLKQSMSKPPKVEDKSCLKNVSNNEEKVLPTTKKSNGWTQENNDDEYGSVNVHAHNSVSQADSDHIEQDHSKLNNTEKIPEQFSTMKNNTSQVEPPSELFSNALDQFPTDCKSPRKSFLTKSTLEHKLTDESSNKLASSSDTIPSMSLSTDSEITASSELTTAEFISNVLKSPSVRKSPRRNFLSNSNPIEQEDSHQMSSEQMKGNSRVTSTELVSNVLNPSPSLRRSPRRVSQRNSFKESNDLTNSMIAINESSYSFGQQDNHKANSDIMNGSSAKLGTNCDEMNISNDKINGSMPLLTNSTPENCITNYVNVTPDVLSSNDTKNSTTPLSITPLASVKNSAKRPRSSRGKSDNNELSALENSNHT